MYMDDAVRATIELMDAEPGALTVRTSYNLAALSFTAGELAEAVRAARARLRLQLRAGLPPGDRQLLADDDRRFRGAQDWGWRPRFDLEALTQAMLEGVGLAPAPPA